MAAIRCRPKTEQIKTIHRRNQRRRRMRDEVRTNKMLPHANNLTCLCLITLFDLRQPIGAIWTPRAPPSVELLSCTNIYSMVRIPHAQRHTLSTRTHTFAGTASMCCCHSYWLANCERAAPTLPQMRTHTCTRAMHERLVYRETKKWM